MDRRSPPQKRTDDHAFPVRVRILVPERGFENLLLDMHHWLDAAVGRGSYAVHGAGAGLTMRRVVLPVLFPAIVAGSIFAFSLTLGDYIAVQIVGGANQMLGNVIYDNVLKGNNLPFAAAVATIPVVIMLVYLAAVRRTGALENL